MTKLAAPDSEPERQSREQLGFVALLALASVCAIEIVERALDGPLTACVRWSEGPHNGNCRVQAAWFFALVGLWLYPALPALAILSLREIARSRTVAARAVWSLVSFAAACAYLRLSQLQLATGALGLYV